MTTVARPLFRDPLHDGATDPTVIWNRQAGEWWMFYTSRRADAPPMDDVSWIHGTDIGIASSADGGAGWLYRGIAEGLDIEPGRHTYWAPEIVDDGTEYHMFVSVIRGVPTQWAGHARVIRHYTSHDLFSWTYRSTLSLSSERVIDACVLRLPTGGYRMWYKDEADDAHTYAADSDDLARWTVRGPAVECSKHEGPNVFELGGSYWMLIDEWHGQRVLHSRDLETWEPRGLILDRPGQGPDDGGYGYHADVVTSELGAFIFYFSHPRRSDDDPGPHNDHNGRRSSIQVARLRVSGDTLVCDRDEALDAPILPLEGPDR
ncbi:glycoside hydrolase family protein [Streptomyces dysideae]|uniref:Glycosyl hydrolase n=1 Tax=Streptomyces dysideae TaxID=909626 RepID=A0A124IDL8_9ACTN|nr:glycosyl hydrolase [Streptomyces dysideae]KUO15561.1 glycosyl hydrolase [Streptomyces dysideae]